SARAGSRIAAKMAIMAITTSSSIRVNPQLRPAFLFEIMPLIANSFAKLCYKYMAKKRQFGDKKKIKNFNVTRLSHISLLDVTRLWRMNVKF
ncbi:MAG TPA: hypothetical protein VKJ65_14505, partial [Phycisphaerae bacterium]|nr:hypothetical protein [Phycisphaerae bacterium]